MNKSIQVVFKDKLDNQILDKDFFSLLFNSIVNLSKNTIEKS